jgi:hypothetical protein
MTAASPLNLMELVDGMQPRISSLPREELTVVLERLKTFGKRVHRSSNRGHEASGSLGTGRLENSMPFEVAEVLNNLAGALALERCVTRIIGLSNDQY